MKNEIKNEIISCIKDLAGSFLYYDRKEDEDLPTGAIEKAIEDELITIDEIVDEFKNSLKNKIK